MKLGLLPVLVLVVGCGGGSAMRHAPSSAASPGGSAYEAAAAGYPSAPAVAADLAAAPPPSPAAKAPVEAKSDAPVARPRPEPRAQSGLLTAGVWDDAKNFDFFLGYSRKTAQSGGDDFNIFSERELADARSESGQRARKRALDVALVFDTTGSMGDELSYLQSEFVSIATTLRNKLPGVEPRFSLVVYRDQGDDYVTRSFPFTTDAQAFRRTLSEQSAGGGGDYPEAVVAGLTASHRLGWRKEADVAKVAFWIADAPTHPGESEAFARVIRSTRAQDIHLYPIAASGTNDLAEYEMRSAALLTGGRYMFLTDDSGVGLAHAEPHIPCYSVTRLDRAIVRMLEIEVTGRHVPVDQGEVVRKVGSPRADGTCVLGNGEMVAAY